ncbi:MAG: hypothetical protein QCI38_02490, partial [Candidatus Thermoplasmatota archaeon]|nr:hypothetical protein [Candidatus Thermoplasmatota archaeon]
MNPVSSKFCGECGIKLEFARAIAGDDSIASQEPDEDLDILLEDLSFEKDVVDDIEILDDDIFGDLEGEVSEEDLLESLLELGDDFEEPKNAPTTQPPRPVAKSAP